MRTLKNLVAFFGGFLAICFVARAMGAEPAAAATPNAPHQLEPPQGSFGVKFCNQLVVWVILQDGKVIRMDKEHHPKTPEEMQLFLKWLESGPSDVQTIPCPTAA